MNQNDIKKRVIKCISKNEDLGFLLQKTKDSTGSSLTSEYEKFGLEAVRKAENLAITIRDTVYSSVLNKKLLLNNQADVSRDIYSVSISENEGILKISVPMLCPHQHKEPHRFLFVSPIMTAFENFKKKNTLPRYENAVVVFRNVINRKQCKNIERDNDNYEYKQVQNIIASYTMADDNAKTCKNYFDTVWGTETFTQIFVVPTEKFAEWFTANLPQQGVYETH